MALPKAIQQAADEADALQQQLYGERQAEAETPAAQTDSSQVQEAPVASEQQASNVVELHTQATPEPESAQPKPAQDDQWQQRYKTLQSKFDREVPALHAQLREQSQQMQNLLAELQKQKESPKADTSSGGEVTPKDEEDFGSDLVDMVRRCAREIVRREAIPLIDGLRKELQGMLAPVAERVERSASDRFWDTVKTFVPDWDAIDNNPDWWEFLNTTPEFAEDSYRELATKAIAKGDATKIANLVKLWRGHAAPQPVVTPATPKPDLQRQVTPSTSRASAPVPQTGKIWTKAEYEAAMDVRNISRVGAAEADRLVAEATQAVAEGRVRW